MATTYVAVLTNDGKTFGQGKGSSKRVAAQRAIADLLRNYPGYVYFAKLDLDIQKG